MRKITLQNKFTALVLLLCFIGVTGWGQVVTIASQDFEVTPATPTLAFTTSDIGTTGTNTGFSTGTSGGTAAPSNSNLFASGSRGYRVQSPASGNVITGRIFTFSSINTTGYTNISLSLRMAGMSIGSAGNGIDETGDSIIIEVSPDNGSNWYKQATVVANGSGALNVRWSFGATGSGTRTYSSYTPISTFNTTALSGTVTSGTTAITTANITSLPSVSKLGIRITAKLATNATANESWIIDDLILQGEAIGTASTYTWDGSTSTDFTVATNWTPDRTTPSTNDILQVNSGGSVSITNLPSQTVGKFNVTNSTSLGLQSSADNALIVNGGTNAFVVENGSTCNFSSATAVNISVDEGSTGSVSGAMTFSNGAHRLLAFAASGITFNSGAVFTAQSTQSGAPFGNSGANNSVVFANGSVFQNRVNGGSPFGVAAPNSKVVFQNGSTYRMQQNSNPFIGGRTVANFEIDAASFSQTITSASATNITGNLVITDATSVTFDLTGGLTVGGNITRTVGTVSFSPTSAANLTLNGTSDQTISGAITFGSNLNLVINKASGLAILGGDYTINRDLTLTSGTLSIGANTLTLAGTVSRTSGLLRGGATSNLSCTNTSALGSLFFDHSTDGTTNALNNFTKTGAGSVTIGNNASATIAQLYINGTLDIQAGSLDVSQAVTGNHLVLVSDGTNLARVADLGVAGTRLTQGANTKIVVERSTLNKRAWRLIAAPLTGNGLGLNTTVQSQWQNTGNILGANTFGTNIYGPSGSGFDATRPGYSMLRWNYGLQNWRNVTNTTTEPMFGNGASGYTSTTDSTVLPTFLFARGDKTITATTGSNAGRLRAVGKLLTGTQTFNYPGVGAGTKYVAVSNPYAAPVDFESLIAGLSGNLKNLAGNTIFYYWDPSLNNFGGAFGGWVTVTRDNGGGYTQNSGTNGRYIQSGTAILIQPSNQASSTAIFEESYKASGSNVSPATHGAGTNTIDKLVVQLRNADNAIGTLDGSIAMFGNGYKKEFDKTEDGIKLEQNNETISFVNGSLKTGVESRGYIQQADTLQMNLLRTTTGTNYSFEFNPSNFDATVLDAKLVDKFLNTETPISLSAKTTVPFSVTATTGSNAADRFMIVFRGTGALPNKGFTVTGEKLGTNKVKVNWEAQAETGVREYALEKSIDGVNYQTVNTQAAKNGNIANSYTFTDNTPVNGLNYYRVKTTQHNDIERYSTVITVNFKQQGTNNVTVYPNPVKGNTIGLQLQDLEKGMYSVRILSIEGKEVYKQQLQVNGSSLNTTINPSTKLAQGTYTLQVVGKSTTYTQKVVVE